MLRDNLIGELDALLAADKFQDYCPNGLQIEGKNEITSIITGVSLNQELIDSAIYHNADAIIVHHGIFWNKSAYPITGIKYQRIAKLIKHDINLIAYHLPLDNHPQLGNNYQLAQLLGITPEYTTGEQNLIWVGHLKQEQTLTEFIASYRHLTAHTPHYFGTDERIIRKIAWCTGGADSMFEAVFHLNVDAFITGEIKEPIMHLAKESKVAFIAGGHYVTERYGISALTKYLKDTFNLDAKFIELYNPIWMVNRVQKIFDAIIEYCR